MKTQIPIRFGFATLELLLILGTLLMVFQLFPSFWVATLWAVDFRNWPRTVWFVANLAVVLALVAIRFGPDLIDEWQKRRERLTFDRANKEKQQQLQAQREMLERLKRGRAHRLY